MGEGRGGEGRGGERGGGGEIGEGRGEREGQEIVGGCRDQVGEESKRGRRGLTGI